MKTSIALILLTSCALAQAEDIRVQQIPVKRIAGVLPRAWFIESVDTAATVSGWDRLQGSRGIRIIISRHPYDLTLAPTKAGGLSVDIPQVVLYVFPSDFEGKHVNNSSIFRAGKVIPSDTTAFADRAVLIMDKFTKVGQWYVFHNAPSFSDWRNPVGDMTEAMKEIPNQGLLHTPLRGAAEP
ncbi:MAG: hypothetical protein AB1714_18200 [Acidobacteriota bacterium]